VVFICHSATEFAGEERILRDSLGPSAFLASQLLKFSASYKSPCPLSFTFLSSAENVTKWCKEVHGEEMLKLLLKAAQLFFSRYNSVLNSFGQGLRVRKKNVNERF
jgi:hypothetical protein